MTTLDYRRLGCAVAFVAITACGGGSKTSTPTVTSVAPTTMCVDGGTLTVTGTDFQSGAVVSINTTDLTTTFGSATSLTATVPSGEPAGTYDVTVTNKDGGTDTLSHALTIVDDPLVFFVDPPTDYNALSVDITIYASGINGTVQKVEIAPHGTTTKQSLTGFSQDTQHPGRIHVTLPSGLAAGAYDVYVTDGDGCVGGLANAFTVTADATLTLTSIDPAFGWTGSTTAVTIKATGGLVATPRVYLNPQAGSGNAAAASAVEWVDDQTITAIVPQGLTPGMYDVIVIDPDGTVGALTGTAGFLVNTAPPPDITSATPAQIDSGTATAVTVTGTGFSATATGTLSCVDATGVVLADQTITPTSVASDGTSLTFTTPLLAAGDVCVITITNPDAAFDKFSALVVTNPASNLEPFQNSTTAPQAVKDLTTPRRALVTVAGHVTKQQRYLYAIGGDSGTDGSALATVEATPIDLFGRMVGWSQLVQGSAARNLDTPRTLAQGVRIGQYIYLAGGYDGTSILGTIVRARILDPLHVPGFDDLDFSTGATPGLAAGAWVYRISAVLPNDGETLPSDPINVTVPDLSAIQKTIQVKITWTPVAGATGYKVYRTRAAGDAASTAVFLADASSTSYTDNGGTTPAADALPPLAIGALGSWYSVGTLTTAREGAAVAAAQGTTANDWFLYVAGGSNGTQALSGYEYLPVTIDPATGDQTAGTVTAGDKNLATARWRGSAWTVDDSVTSNAGGHSWVYFGTGENFAETQTVAQTSVGEVDPATGLLTSTAATLDTQTAHSVHSGTGAVAANGFLYDFGGGPTPSGGGSSAELCRPGLGGCATQAPPELANWNSLGAGGVLLPRYLSSAAIESAFIYVAGGIGGATGTAVQATVERTTL